MNVPTDFHQFLFSVLKSKVYVLLNVFPLKRFRKDGTLSYDVLLKKEVLEEVVKEIQKYSEIANIQVFTTFRASKALLELKDNTKVVINFIHKLVHKSLAFLNEDEILNNRSKTDKMVCRPSIEHLFEYTVLKNFLNFRALDRYEFEYFDDFHVLVKEDLLEYFNMKHGTSFSNFYQLTNYNHLERQRIIKDLKTAPTNGFLKKINVRWHSFLGYMKQARII